MKICYIAHPLIYLKRRILLENFIFSMNALTAAIFVAIAVLYTQQNVPPKRPPEANTHHTVVIRADSIRVSRPNSAPAVQGWISRIYFTILWIITLIQLAY